ncbi:nicotinate-nucleotide--dimethylbenzimidazole phosphoribosyltransferase [Streptomyces sp. SCSIO 30461]|uniref:nicotinate-nucleotide--dimethylbenzimidazole phosphoribosyltransferase n=1 Tax=Streptomyces sp. SCSIO 30461 TaxID=3118085 RepID=UPI0030CC95D9
MTDTGRIPGEGLPENAGMVEQPGIPAPGAYTFLDPSEGAAATEEDDLLLMPGAQGAWSEAQTAAPVGGHFATGAPGAPAGPQQAPTPVARTVAPDAAAAAVRAAVQHAAPQAGAPSGPAHQTQDPVAAPVTTEPVSPRPVTSEPQVPVAAEPVIAPQPASAEQVVPQQTGHQPAAATAPPTPRPAAPQQAAVEPSVAAAAAGQQAPVAPDPVATEQAAPQQAVSQQPVPETGAHEAGGRDSGSLDLGGVRVPPTSSTPTPPPGRRPLHMGPPVPDATGGVVRSLADRGPANAPSGHTPPHPIAVRHAGPPTTGPEYLDVPRDEPMDFTGVPQSADTAPQEATPWPPVAVPSFDVPVDMPEAPQASGPAEVLETAEPPQALETSEAGETAETAVPGAAEVANVPVAAAPIGTAAHAPVAETAAVETAAVETAETAGGGAVGPEAAASEVTATEPAAPPTAPEHMVPVVPAPRNGGAPPVAVVPEARQATESVAAESVAAEPAMATPQQVPEALPESAAESAVHIQTSTTSTTGTNTETSANIDTSAHTGASTNADSAEAAPAPVVDTAVADTTLTEATVPATADTADATPASAGDTEPVSAAAPGYGDAEREAVLRVIRERRDIRNGFRGDPIPHEVLLRVLEAAHTAPSVGHSQPWDFVVIRSAETRRAMHELAQRQREAYAKSLPKGRAKQFKELKIEAILDTPVNIVVTADPTRGGRHTLGRHTQPQMAPYSSALAVENLWLAARAEGLGVGWVSFFDEREMVRALGLPEHLEVVAYLCVGYVDEFPEEPELMQAGWSKRRPLSWVVHEETYGRRALPGEEPHDLLQETVSNIRPLDAKALGEAWERQKRMTKPSGALGMLEIISAQLAGLSRMCPPPIPEPAAVAIFAGDHGVHAQGVTAWPQEVTGQMVANFLGGGAVCNAFANQVGAEVCVIDVGVASDLPATPGLLPRKVRPGTADFTTGPALSREDVVAAIEVGIETARDLVAAGNKALLTGEMGIANTTASAALIAVYTGTEPAEVTGRGTGINDEMHARKVDVVRRAVELHQPDPADPVGVLAAIGGLEHAALVGFILGGASLRTPVILDGVSAGAAALVARAVAPEALAACIAGHRSAEPGHVAALNKLGLRPLVDLDLRLGEGTGALLALPLVQSAARAMHEVATFDSAGVTEK